MLKKTGHLSGEQIARILLEQQTEFEKTGKRRLFLDVAKDLELELEIDAFKIENELLQKQSTDRANAVVRDAQDIASEKALDFSSNNLSFWTGDLKVNAPKSNPYVIDAITTVSSMMQQTMVYLRTAPQTMKVTLHVLNKSQQLIEDLISGKNLNQAQSTFIELSRAFVSSAKFANQNEGNIELYTNNRKADFTGGLNVAILALEDDQRNQGGRLSPDNFLRQANNPSGHNIM
jgi:hypothetical protein